MEESGKISVLRSFEKVSYSACFYILKNETQSIVAAKKVLYDIFCHEDFYTVSPSEQLKIIQVLTIKYTLQLLNESTTKEQ